MIRAAWRKPAGKACDHIPVPGDWTNVAALRASVESIIKQLRVIHESPIVRAAGATVDDVAEHVGRAVDVLADRGRKLTDRAAEGITAFLRHGNGGSGGAEALEDFVSGLPANVADDSAESVGEAISRTYRRTPDATGMPAPEDLGRVDDALLMGRAEPAGYEGVLNNLIGEGHVIKSLEEWNALKAMPADALRPDQVTAIKLITDQLWSIEIGTSISRIVPLDGVFGGIDMVQNGTATMAGFFARASDVFDASTTPQLIDWLRLDSPPFNFQPDSTFARIKTTANADIVGKSRLPRHAGFSSGHPKEEILSNLPYPQGHVYPFTGKGVPASLDGRTLPEMKIAQSQNATMSAGIDAAQQPVTVLEFRFADGTPYPRDIEGVTASDWKLMPHPTIQGQYQWVPLFP